jgi:O-antigen/teichoic acid export membrane protein
LGTLWSDSFFLVLNTVVGSALGFVFWIVIARRVDVSEVGGAAAVASLVALVATLGDMGLGTTLLRFLNSPGLNRSGFINAIALSTIAASVVVAVTAIVVASSGLPLLGSILSTPTVAVAVALAAIAFALGQVADKVLIAARAAHLVLSRSVVANITRVSALFFLGIADGPTLVTVSVGLGAVVSVLAVCGPAMRRVVPDYSPFAKPDFLGVRSRLKYSIGNHLALVIWSAPAYVFPLVFIELLGPESNAYFYASWMLANMIYAIPLAASTTAFARLAGGAITQDAYARTSRWVAAILIPVVGMACALAGPLLGVFGADYVTNASLLTCLLAVAALPLGYNTFAVTQLRMSPDPRRVAAFSLAVTLTCGALVWVLGSQWGLAGVGVGWFVGQAVWAVCLATTRFWRQHSKEA